MATLKDTVAFILERLGNNQRFSVRAMFGEYALYADGKVVAFMCDDMLYVKIMPASVALESVCEKASPYPSAKPHYLVDEECLSSVENLPAILIALAAAISKKK